MSDRMERKEEKGINVFTMVSFHHNASPRADFATFSSFLAMNSVSNFFCEEESLTFIISICPLFDLSIQVYQ